MGKTVKQFICLFFIFFVNVNDELWAQTGPVTVKLTTLVNTNPSVMNSLEKIPGVTKIYRDDDNPGPAIYAIPFEEYITGISQMTFSENIAG